MATCKVRQFRSLTKKDALDLGTFHASARVGNDGGNVVLQLHGHDEDSTSCDTGIFSCFFPRQAAALAMKILDACHDQGFDVAAFEKKWLARNNSENLKDHG